MIATDIVKVYIYKYKTHNQLMLVGVDSTYSHPMTATYEITPTSVIEYEAPFGDGNVKGPIVRITSLIGRDFEVVDKRDA